MGSNENLSDEHIRSLFAEPPIYDLATLSRLKCEAMADDRYWTFGREIRHQQVIDSGWLEKTLARRRAQEQAERAQTLNGKILNLLDI